MRVLLVTSWGQPQCGIQAHSEALIAAVRQADPEIVIVPSAEALDPNAAAGAICDIIHLNYHRGLHSRWTPDQVQRWQRSGPAKVVITYHDTIGEHPPDQLTSDLHDRADAFIVHEPCQGLEKAIYWRMGVPDSMAPAYHMPDYHRRPYLGTVGFDFPWKNFPELARVTGELGWGLLIACPEMAEAREQELRQLNSFLQVRAGADAEMVVSYLRGCDATAFMYTCANTGQSAAILQGIAARKTVYALHGCRQFRSLAEEEAIQWVTGFEDLQDRLLSDPIQRIDPNVVVLAEQESWTTLGARYAGLYRGLGEGR
jgi:hypothetical protein